MKKITWDNNYFYVNGEREKFVSGSIHYFRVHPEYWRDRLLKLKECGCNCVETYVPWHLHEKRRGELDFTGWLDLGAYLDLISEMGLYAIVRPGPYICSECDFGGLPWWLLKTPDIAVRCSDERYQDACKPYLERVCDMIRPRLISNGGCVAFIQLENEYGSYGNDKKHLEWLRDLYIKNGIDCPLITSDGAFSMLLKYGTLDGILASVNYRSDSSYLDVLRDLRPNQPLAIMELWTGRQDHWDKNNAPRDIAEVKKSVEDAVDKAELVNMYMFHGGTTFGFMNSIHEMETLTVVTNSYDVDAPLDEFGRRTPKYYAEQEAICKRLGLEINNTATDTVLYPYPNANFVGTATLRGLSLRSTDSITTLPMEAYDQGYGYIIYTADILVDYDGVDLVLPEVHDIAHVYIDGEYKAVFDRCSKVRRLPLANGVHKLAILVESMGRVQIGHTMIDRKGLVGDVKLDLCSLGAILKPFGYTVYNLPLDILPETYNEEPKENAPAFYKYELEVEEPRDTVVNFSGFTRGVAFVNGFNLGRHWDTTYKKNRAYIPAPLLKKGKNEIVVFDVLHKASEKRIWFGE